MSRPPQLVEASTKAYVTGFVLSLLFTFSAYASVQHHIFNRRGLMATVVVLALAQFLTQLVYFLHLGKETGPRWKLLVFLFMLLIVGILVVGSLWIMSNLNYRMTPQQINQYMQNQDGGI